LGSASGDNRIEEAIDQAIRSPLLEGESISGASKLIVTFWADENITLADLDYAMQRIENELAADNLVVFGATLVPETDKFEVTIIATGFQQESGGYKASAQPLKKPEKPPIEQPPTPPQQPASPYPPDSNISRVLTKLRQKGFGR
jgi:cell division protein FtsZ